MVKEIEPKQTRRAEAFELWMQDPNPMVTFFKTLDVTPLVKTSKRKNLKFNMLLDYCIGKAASSIEEFYILPVDGKLMQYDSIAVNTIVKNKDGGVSSCDILYTDDLEKYNCEYLKYTSQDAKLFIFVHVTKCAFISSTADGQLENQTARLTGRTVNHSLISHVKTPFQTIH